MAKNINIKDKTTEFIVKKVLDNVGIGITIINRKMEVVWLNRIFKKWFPGVDVKTKPICYRAFYFPPKSRACEYCPAKKAFEIGETHAAETGVCANGRTYNLVAAPIKDVKGKVTHIIETVADITRRKRIEEALKESEEQYRITIESMGEAIHVVDRSLRFLMFNKKFQEWNATLGLDVDVIGRKIFEVFPFLAKKVKAEYQKVFNIGKIVVTEEVVKVRDKEFITETRKIPIIEKGKVVRVITVIRDITEHKRNDEKLEVLNKKLTKTNRRLKQFVLRDVQTGLFNYRYLGEIIEAEFLRAKRSGHPLSIIMLDIDYFKSINEVYGHHFGDLVLKQLARQLKRMVRKYDIVIRFGGEEFAIISPGTDKSTALLLARRLLDDINLYNFGNKKDIVKLKLSIAVATFPEDRIVLGGDLIELVQQILSKVKECGGNNVYSAQDLKKAKLAIPGREEPEDVKFLKEKIDKLTKGANQSLIEAVLAFAKTLELKDHYSGEHVEKTVRYATELARALNLSNDEIERIRQASILHDLGKIGISDKILLKRSKLSKYEFEEIKKHPRIGVDIIRPIQFLHNLIPLILYHHERWDGRGYPNGLKGEDIPVGARIIALADVYQALTSDRPYRRAFSKQEAIKIIKEGSGTQFDPAIVEKFLQVLEEEI